MYVDINLSKKAEPYIMLLITPDLLVQMLVPKEYKSFLGDLFPSVPGRTLRDLKKGASPSRKTIEAIVRDLSVKSSLSEAEIREMLSTASPRPWDEALKGLKRGMKVHYAPSFDYVAGVIIDIENAPHAAARARRTGDSRWQDRLRPSVIPSSVMPDSFVDTMVSIISNASSEKEQRVVPIETGEVLLRTNLFVLAALEISLLHSGMVPADIGLWGHRAMPFYRDGKLIEPMRIFFEAVMARLEATSVRAFAEMLHPFMVQDIDSRIRQIRRWMAGKQPPGWDYVRRISDNLFDGDDGGLFSYGVVRFLQSLLMEMRTHGVPKFIAGEKELVAIFQEYPEWQQHHLKAYGAWKGAGSV